MTAPPHPSSSGRIAGIVRLALFLAVLIGFGLIIRALHLEEWIAGLTMNRPLMIGMLLLYTILMAIPFVPGVEIGLAVMILFGALAAPWVYMATVSGLLIAFFGGRIIPDDRLYSVLRLVGLGHKISALQAPMTQTDRLLALFGNTRVVSRLIEWRYIALAVLLNMPGNMVIGGGGGIAVLSGVSRGFHPIYFALTVALAVSPIPIIVYLFGPAML